MRLTSSVMADDNAMLLPLDSTTTGDRDRPTVAAAAGVALDFDRLVARYQERVTRLCYRLLGWRQDVDDLVQDVFLAVFRGLPEFRGDSDVSTWITTITVNACRSHLRKRVLRLRLFRRDENVDENPRVSRHGGDPSDPERDEHVRRAVRKLPAKYREVVVLRYLEELSVSDVAAVLGLRKNAVEVRLNRARKRLKDDLAGLIDA